MRYIIGIYLLLAACSQPQPMKVNVTPKPQSLEVQEGMFVLNHSTTRNIRVKSQNYGTLPNWHPATGSPSWIYMDEVLIQ